MVDAGGIGKGGEVVGKGFESLGYYISWFTNGFTDYIKGLSWVEWFIIGMVVVLGLVLWVLKRYYDSNLSYYEKNRIKKYKF